MNRKKLPKFKSEAEEKKFWEQHDSADYLDWSSAKKVKFSALKPSTKTISLRLPESMLHDLKIMANKQDVPYQSLMKMLLAESIQNHMGN